jgi:cellulose synthase/poly-beta-1,6-N-acetylglucosamine synthase-like glycosyltransferase
MMTFLFFLFFIYFSLVMVYYLVLGIIGLFEGQKKKIEEAAEDFSLMASSTFTIPVTIIIPARNEEVWIAGAVQSAVDLDYPQFEVIVVDDGSTDNTLKVLQELLDLGPQTKPYIDNFNAGKIFNIFVSRKYPFVTVLSKESGHKKAGALNAALNLAKYKYVCTIDADTLLEPDALLKVMAHVQKDPDKIVGVGSYYGLINGFKVSGGRVVERSFDRRPLIAYQNLEYIRTFIGNRIAWSSMNASPIVSGGFAIWRRDIVLAVGGFAELYSSEDLEFTFRVHEYLIRNRVKGYRIMMLPYFVGWTYGPAQEWALVKQRNRWQRVADESVARYKHAILNPRYGKFGLVTMPYFLMYEVLGVFFETASWIIAIVGLWAGVISYDVFLTFFVFMYLWQAIVSLLSLFIFSRITTVMKASDIVYLATLSLAEFFWYRWLILFAKWGGTLAYLRGERSHDQFLRTA